jgi:hypothetical protein
MMPCPCCNQVDCGYCDGVTGVCGYGNCRSEILGTFCGQTRIISRSEQPYGGVVYDINFFSPNTFSDEQKKQYAGCYFTVLQSECWQSNYPCCGTRWEVGYYRTFVYVWLKDKCLWEKIQTQLPEVTDIFPNTCVQSPGTTCGCGTKPECTPPLCPETISGKPGCACNNPFP